MLRPRLIGLLLVLVTLLVYEPVCRYSLVVYDDDDYVTENQVVQNGLTWAGVKWAFTTWHASNWHPLTWLSHMMDCEMFGPNAGAYRTDNVVFHFRGAERVLCVYPAGAHHLVNVVFHAANVVLLFALLLRLTGALWPGAFVAALFAWHPLHVESVAWISERKDVLSTFFGLLTLLSYTRFVEESRAPSPKAKVFYALALLMFALGLMSKPMLVTLPFVMLLLDFWPLQWSSESKNTSSRSTRGRSASAFGYGATAPKRSEGGQLPTVLEKWPFFLLAIVSCIVTFLAQRRGEAVVSLAKVSLRYRLENAPVALVRYLLKMIWPADLAVIYPMPDKIPVFAIAAAVAALILISAAAWRARRRSPCFLVGWLWFLGTLVPVLGLVQVGSAALADRYTYIPSIGVFVAAAFGLRDLAGRFPIYKAPVTVAAGLTLAGCLLLTENQLRCWRDSETLFRHALAVTKDNSIAHVNLGIALDQQGRYAEALAEYREAARLVPGRYRIHNNLGNLLDKMGRPEQALAEYREAVRLKPELSSLHDGLGSILAELGRFAEAMNEFTNAARLDPVYPWTYWEMGKSLLKQGRDAEAMDCLHEALRLDPDNFKILAYTARVLAADENPEIRDGKTAVVLAAKANILTGGTQPLVLDVLGMACAETGDFTDAKTATQQALAIAVAAKMEHLEGMQQRLKLYKNQQPWRESFLFTNAPAIN
jgi:tetratricopeptide (TPR) repeat protein